MDEDVIGGRVSLVAEDGECENFHRSARALPAARGHAGRITCRYDVAGHSLNSRLCRVPGRGGKMTNHIYTVGHSSRDFDEMLAMLENNEITHLVDVHSFLSSRKFPQWNQSAVTPAVLHKHACVQDGHLTYPPQP